MTWNCAIWNFHVIDITSIVYINMKQFISSNKTEDVLTIYLAQKRFIYFEHKPEIFNVTSRIVFSK